MPISIINRIIYIINHIYIFSSLGSVSLENSSMWRESAKMAADQVCGDLCVPNVPYRPGKLLLGTGDWNGGVCIQHGPSFLVLTLPWLQ